MDLNRGWSADASIVIGYRVVLYLHKGHDGAPGGVTVQNVAGGIGTNIDGIATARTWLETNSLAVIGAQPVQGFYMFRLTETGAAAGDRWSRGIGNDAERRRACRAAILDWLDIQTGELVKWTFPDDPRANFFGDPFTGTEVIRAAYTLRDRGLIEIKDSAQQEIVLVKMLEDGRDCHQQFSGDVDAWRARNSPRGGDTYTSHIYESPGAQVMAGSPGGQQSSTVTITNIGRQQLLTIADQIIDNLAALDLDRASRAEADEAARELRTLADQPDADKGRARALLGVIATSAAGVVGTESGQTLMHLISQGVQAIGS